MWKNKEFHELASQQSRNIFLRFNSSINFFDFGISLWETNADYKEAKQFFSNLRVVNDAAERAVALVTKFNSCLTNDEEQKQYFYKVVQEHRQMYSSVKKSELRA